MTKISFHNFIQKLKRIKKSYTYILSVLGISILFWYIYFSNKNFDMEDFVFYTFMSAISFDNFIGMFTLLPHKNIPEDYPLWGKIFIRAILFLVVFIALIIQLFRDNIITM